MNNGLYKRCDSVHGLKFVLEKSLNQNHREEKKDGWRKHRTFRYQLLKDVIKNTGNNLKFSPKYSLSSLFLLLKI